MENMQREFWNDLAGPKWAAAQSQMDDTLAPYVDALRGAVAGLPSGARVVDVGCGCGATTLMAHRGAPDAEILGLDVSEPMLAVARERAARLRTERVRFQLGDAASEAIEPGSVDLIISRFGVMFFPEPAAAFAHMRRWLKPSGRMVLMVWGQRSDNPWLTQTLAALGKHIELPPPDPNAPGPFSLGDAARRAALFQAAGLLVDEELPVTRPMRVRGDTDVVTDFFASRGPAALALENASTDAREAALTSLRDLVVEAHDGRGTSMPARALRLTLVADPNAPEPEPEAEEEDPGSRMAEAAREAAEASADAQPEPEAEGDRGSEPPPDEPRG